MRLIIGGVLILLGVISWAAFFLTYEKPACLEACGCCPGGWESGQTGGGEFVSFWKTKLVNSTTPRSNCSLVGCGPRGLPIYWDLGLVGVGLVVTGVVILVKRK